MIKPDYSDKTRIVELLTKAFYDNQSVNYVVKQDRKREARIRYLMDYSFDICWHWGEIYITDNKKGAVLLLLPHKKKNQIKSTFLDIKLALRTIGLRKILKVIKRENYIKKYHPDYPFYYLWFIGVLPDEQGKGFGSKLLQEVIEESQKHNYSIYLETSTLRNIPFYKKFQFETYHELKLNYTLHMMKREPGNNHIDSKS